MTVVQNNRNLAKETLEYVQQVVWFSDNYPSRSLALKIKPYDAYNQQLYGINQIIVLIRETTKIIQDRASKVGRIAHLATKFHCGNCSEMAAVGYQYATKKTTQTVDIGYIDGGDHAFLVIGRKKNVPIHDYRNWGEDAYICDPWASKFYPAEFLETHLRNFCWTLPCPNEIDETITEPFDPMRHKLGIRFTNNPFIDQTLTESFGSSTSGELKASKCKIAPRPSSSIQADVSGVRGWLGRQMTKIQRIFHRIFSLFILKQPINPIVQVLKVHQE